ncbi:hypothetical protein ACQKII_03690 [Lysinibacillus sp. NPDC048646]
MNGLIPSITMPYVFDDEVKSSSVARGVAIYFLMDLRAVPEHMQKYARK